MRIRLGFLLTLWLSAAPWVEPVAAQETRGSWGYVATYEAVVSGQGRIHVLEVHEGGAAQRAGLVPGDLIHRIDGETFRFENDLHMIRTLTRIPPQLNWRFFRPTMSSDLDSSR